MYLNLGELGIRPYQHQDLEALVHLADNPLIAANLRDIFPSPYTRQDGINWLEMTGEMEPLTAFAITCNDTLIGGIGLIIGDDIHRHSAEIGYWLGQPYWGKGYGSQVVAAFTEEAFRYFGLHRIFAEVFASNPASVRLLEKCGYHYEGRTRGAVLKGGYYIDCLLFARLADDEETPLVIDAS